MKHASVRMCETEKNTQALFSGRIVGTQGMKETRNKNEGNGRGQHEVWSGAGRMEESEGTQGFKRKTEVERAHIKLKRDT